MLSRLLVLKAQGCDVYFITRYLTAAFGGPREPEVVLRKMQEMYFWDRMGVRLGYR
jgi:hypothetical protein